MTNEFQGRRVLIAGGTSGVGLASAEAFAARGAEVTVVSRSEDKVRRAVKSLGPAAAGHVLDLRDSEAVAAFAEGAGAFDHVVVSAAETPMGRVDTLPLEDAYAAMDSKFWGAYRLARAVGVDPAGSLTIVTGYLSVRPGRASALQSAINAALEALVRGLALELSPVRVNAVSPGLLRTPLWDGLPAGGREAMYEAASQRLPVNRVGEPQDVAAAIAMVAGNAYMTGTTLFVDGGGSIA
ncbi:MULTISPECIES: SDR family oxidoreductase [unclassified Streptomyces]|uniref:SDR family oxidoreductase n=1 Tax=unclassified Streptomyces TaxID=2593676 RepID=UPI001BE6D601|nr:MULTISPECIES: SDR family oxidoreductase [unclassified Streptomyces]MBT2406183.1 SDR family oxidoreductase [Streptomyces sp. ISL-21]MBT2609241.1 SDR family oxidoreductase [Streptomyces sp. ISL-87]